MRATVMYGAGDVRVESVPDPVITAPTDAIVRVLRSCICGSDLWPYRSMIPVERGNRMGHEFLGVVEDLGADVSRLRRGDVVVAPFVWADNTCDFCQEGLQTSCRHGGRWGGQHLDGGQGEAMRAPQYAEVPLDFGVFLRNITLTGGAAPARAYIEALLPDVLDGRIEPGKVFDRTIGLDEVPDGYRAMAKRAALKVLVTP